MDEILDLKKRNEFPEPDNGDDFPETPEEKTESAIMGWEAPEINHELISHGLRKFVIILFIALAVLAVIWQRSLLSAITFVAIALVTSLHFHKKNKLGEYYIHPKGVVAKERFYDYRNLESFCIHHDPDGLKELSLQSDRRLMSHIKIPLGDQDPEEVRAALSMYLVEDLHEHGPDDYLRIKLGL